jgi:hypothetical protein
MDQVGGTTEKDHALQTLQSAMIRVVARVGFLTLAIIALAVLAGLWLDNQLDTRPLFAFLCLFGTVPVTFFLVYRVVQRSSSEIKTAAEQATKPEKKEPERGERHTNEA